MNKFKKFILLGSVLFFVGLILSYMFIIRPWHMRWGATDQEVAMTLPGDAIAAPDAETSTRAITIYAAVRSSFTMFATVNEGAGLFATLIAIWASLSIPALTIAMFLLPLAVLLGIVAALLIWGISAACNHEHAPNKAVTIGSGTCTLIAVLLIVLLNQCLGLTWAPIVAEALTFWLALPLLVFIVAGGLESLELNRRLDALV